MGVCCGKNPGPSKQGNYRENIIDGNLIAKETRKQPNSSPTNTEK